MTNKEKYRILCKTETSIPIFSRDWWLDCVCEESGWDVLLVENKGIIEAIMPIFIPYPKVISTPVYTIWGIWFNSSIDDLPYSKKIFKKQQLTAELIRQIPPFKVFSYLLYYTFTDWLPFYWTGYIQTTRYTYIFPDISNKERLWSNFSSNIKRNITKAKAKLEVRKNIPVNEFLRVNNQTFERQGKKAVNPEILKQLIETCQSKKQGDIWGVYDKQNQLHAAIFVAWQDNCAHYIAGGSNPELRKSGAHSLVMWEAICFVSSVSTTFDFGGSMLKGVERFFREFGAIQMPYFTITKGKRSFINKVFYYFIKKINHLIK